MSRLSLEERIKAAVYTLDEEKILETTRKLIDEGVSPIDLVNAFANVLKEVGDKYERGELFLVELVVVGESVRKAMSEFVEPKLRELGMKREAIGKVVIGTVEGDIHDIGKNIVAALLSSAGFEVIDIGKDVPTEKFVEAVKEYKPDILGLSALMTMTMIKQKEVIEALKRAGIRDKVKVIIGGAPTSQEWAEEIGADAYGADAVSAVRVCKSLIGKA